MDRTGWNARYAQREFVWSLTPNQTVVAETSHLKPGRALDLACGEGRNAVWLAQQGWQVSAVDFAETGLDKARQLASSRGVAVDWILADVTTYAPPPEAFELVLIAYLHIPAQERRQLIQHAGQALKAGGTLLYVGHDLSNIEHGWGGPQDPQVLCTPQDITALLPGWQIEKAEVIERPVSLEPGHGKPGEPGAIALDALVRAVKPAT